MRLRLALKVHKAWYNAYGTKRAFTWKDSTIKQAIRTIRKRARQVQIVRQLAHICKDWAKDKDLEIC